MKPNLALKDLVKGVRERNHSFVSQAITLIESDSVKHWSQACELLSELGKTSQPSLRIAVSGPPGVGKSTFIENLGLKVLAQGQSLAVLAVDPSSQLSGGSILGDKTRMEILSREEKAFIRPSPSRGHMGGVTESLPGSLEICEAAGFDVILVETVGVGQSEVSVAAMVDHMTLLVQPGSGDDLQGIKKGVLEFVDSLVINKVDQNLSVAQQTQRHLQSALKIMRGLDIPIFTVSALKDQGIQDYLKFFKSLKVDPERRQAMTVSWFYSLLKGNFRFQLQNQSVLQTLAQGFENEVRNKKQRPMEAAQKFFQRLLEDL